MGTEGVIRTIREMVLGLSWDIIVLGYIIGSSYGFEAVMSQVFVTGSSSLLFLRCLSL